MNPAGARGAGRRRRLRAAGALCLGLLAHGAGSCPHRAAAQEPGECEALNASTLAAEVERLGLDADQSDWLAARLAAGALEDPGDLDDLPGAGAAQIEALTAAFCWGHPARGEAVMTGRGDPAGGRREARARIAAGSLEASGRARWESGAGGRVRGGIAWGRGAWTLRGGTLRARLALGRLVATPGAEPRGDAPVVLARSGWGTTLSLDPEIPAGVVLVRSAGATRAELAVVRGSVSAADGTRSSRWWGTASWERTRASGRWGLTLVRSGGLWAAGGFLEAAAGPGAWSMEASRAADGQAAGTAVSLRAGQVRVRADLATTGAGYRVPGIRSYRNRKPTESVRFGVEGRWQRGRGRFLRVLVRGERTPGDAAWARVTRVQEVELGERLRGGLHLALRWRITDAEDAGGNTQDQRMRSDLVYAGGGWRVRVRIDRRAGDGAGLLSLRAGRRGRIAWEAGMDRVTGPGEAWVYRRRAGALYGWDRLETGTWIGGWVRIPVSRWEMELSADGRSAGWEAALALRVAFGLP